MTTTSFKHDDLRGVWAALPAPWKNDGSLDRKTFTTDIARICRAGVHGVYSGGTTGEFYAQDFELFCEVNEALVKTAHRHGTPVQAGCTALDTAQVQKRVSFARKIGADAIQVALPFWLGLDDDEVLAFFEAVADTARRIPIVHYDTGRSKRRVSPQLYQRICKRVPTLWGTKFGGDDIWAIKHITMVNPQLRVFTGENIFASAVPMGVTGMYSAFVNVNPAWMLEYYEAARARNWDRAFELQDEACTLLMGLFELASPAVRRTRAATTPSPTAHPRLSGSMTSTRLHRFGVRRLRTHIAGGAWCGLLRDAKFLAQFARLQPHDVFAVTRVKSPHRFAQAGLVQAGIE